jgi:hypothetical protein
LQPALNSAFEIFWSRLASTEVASSRCRIPNRAALVVGQRHVGGARVGVVREGTTRAKGYNGRDRQHPLEPAHDVSTEAPDSHCTTAPASPQAYGDQDKFPIFCGGVRGEHFRDITFRLQVIFATCAGGREQTRRAVSAGVHLHPPDADPLSAADGFTGDAYHDASI